MEQRGRSPSFSPDGISLVVTDLDGTLWDREGCVHELTKQALRELAQRNLPVLAATARRPASAWQAMCANGLALPAVLFDGALGRDFITGETFHQHAFEPDRAVAVLAALLSQDLEPCVNIVDEARDVIVGARPATHPAHLQFIAPWLRHGDLATAVRDNPVLSFIVCGRERERLLPALEAVKGIASGSVSHDLSYGGYTLGIRPPGVSKWNGVLAYCRRHDLDPSRVLAIGDGENDVELLRSAAVACAVTDGCDSVLRLAHYELGPANEGGWRAILDILDRSS